MPKPLILSVSAWRGSKCFPNQVLTDASQMPEALRGAGRRDDALQAADIIEQLLEHRERLLSAVQKLDRVRRGLDGCHEDCLAQAWADLRAAERFVTAEPELRKD